LLSQKHLELPKNEIQAITTDESAFDSRCPSSVAPLQELTRSEAKIFATKALVSTFGGIKAAELCGYTA
jgi:hypothetical protein